MNRLASDRQAILATRFRTLVLAWLDALPPGGWEGGSKELADELEDLSVRKKVYAYVPRTVGPMLPQLEAILAERGFRITFHRTKTARTVRVERMKRTK